jgi:hypothetical protein
MAHKRKLADAVASKLPPPKPAADAEQVTQSQSGDVLEARSTSKRIKTVEDLLRHIEADMSRFEIAASEATKWECGDGDGGSIELHRVFVRLKPKGGPTTREVVQAMIDAARKDIRKPLTKPVKAPKRDAPWQVLVVADPHFGKYAWGKTTGGDSFVTAEKQTPATRDRLDRHLKCV